MIEKKDKSSEFKVSLNADDFVSFNLQGSGFTFISIFAYVAIVIAVLAASGFYKELSAAGFIRYIWIPLGLYVLLCGAYYGYVRWKAVRFFKKSPEMFNEVVYQILNKGLNVKRGRDHKTVQWESFYRVAGNRRVLAFFTSKSNAYIVPIAAIEEAGVIDELTGLLKAKVPKQRLHLPRGW